MKAPSCSELTARLDIIKDLVRLIDGRLPPKADRIFRRFVVDWQVKSLEDDLQGCLNEVRKKGEIFSWE